MGRFDALVGESAGRFVLSEERLESIRRLLATTEPVRLQTNGPAGPVPADALNRDLLPRDEYFLNNPSGVESRLKPSP